MELLGDRLEVCVSVFLLRNARLCFILYCSLVYMNILLEVVCKSDIEVLSGLDNGKLIDVRVYYLIPPVVNYASLLSGLLDATAFW